MATTQGNFPKGFSAVTVRGIPLVQTHPGKVFWVSNASTAMQTGQKTGSDGNKGTFDAPFATLDYAVGQCTGSRGDIIFVKPGHAETYSAAGSLTLDVAGVAIVGLGSGSLRPTFTLDTATTATIRLSASNCSMQNVVVSANFADIVSAFTFTTGGVAKYFSMENVEVKATATNMNFLHVFDTNVTTAAADGLYIDGLKWIEPDAATLGAILLDGTNDDWVIKNSYINIGHTTAVGSLITGATTKIVTNLVVSDIMLTSAQTDGSAGVLISSDATTWTGFVHNTLTKNADAAANIIVFATSNLTPSPINYHSGVANQHGAVLTTVFDNS